MERAVQRVVLNNQIVIMRALMALLDAPVKDRSIIEMLSSAIDRTAHELRTSS